MFADPFHSGIDRFGYPVIKNKMDCRIGASNIALKINRAALFFALSIKIPSKITINGDAIKIIG